MNVNDLTMGEIDEIEVFAQQPLSSLGKQDTTNTKLLIGLAWVIKRKENPAFSLEHAKRMKMDEITALLEDDDEDPKAKS
jgi:hypothetical protein